jgi:5-hydroxyisourate hydrolase-like protein (transthyretin family)
MNRTRRAAPVVVAVACLAAIGPASALAGGHQYATFFTAFKYKLKNGESKFKGQIDSTKGNCVGDRKVVLYRKKSGDKKKLGGDHTNNKGKFDIELGGGNPKSGTYFAVVNQAKIGDNDGKKNTCLSQKSPKLKLTG